MKPFYIKIFYLHIVLYAKTVFIYVISCFTFMEICSF